MKLFRKRLNLLKHAIIITGLFFPDTVRAASLVFPPFGHSYGIRKATPKHLFMFFGPRTFFDDPQGLATTRLKSWDDPRTEKDDDEVVVYGVNSGRHEIIYNTSMWSLGLYGGKGSGTGKFLFPKGIVADPDGNVFVADSGNNRIVHLFNPKSGLQWKKAFGKDLSGPSRIAIDEQKRVYVTDRGNCRIAVYTYDGDLKSYITGRTGEKFTDGPTALAVADGSNYWSRFTSEKLVFCADKNGTRVWKLGFDGTVYTTVNLPEGYHASYGAIDYYHNYWITDTKKSCVLKFDHDLVLLDIFGSYGTGDNQFVEPRGITIYKRYGQVFVAEKKGAQYYWIGTELKDATLRSEKDGFTLTTKATEYSFLTLFTTAGKDTSFYFKRMMVYPGLKTLHVGNRFPASLKRDFMLKIEPTYSSYTYNHWYFPLEIKESN